MGESIGKEMLAKRYLIPQIEHDLERKMVFVAGPRQVGKTTMALSLPGARDGYLNWDIAEHRERILKKELPASELWVFDEIHKYRSWRDWLKGVYDERALRELGDQQMGRRILVTGSARLDFYRFSGDSLQGRYHLLRMLPLSVAELGLSTREDLEALLNLSGFPEPFLSGSRAEARRWSREHRTLLIREELASLERIQDLGNLELLALRLPELVGSLLSLNALREDLQVSHKTVANWVSALERLYAIVRILPFGHPALRAIKKSTKHYHYDWSVVPDKAARFENLVALHLLKWVHFLQDSEGRDLELRFFRDSDGREVDFVVTEDRRPVLLVEAKLSEERPDKSLRYLKERFGEAEAYQITLEGRKDFVTPHGIRVMPALEYLRQLV